MKSFATWVAVGLTLLFFGLAWADDPKALVLDRCVSCHDLEKTCLVETNDVQWWDQTIARMVEYEPDLLSAAESDTIRGFLTQSGSRKTLCP
jgi:hypothetical protein